MEDKAKLFEIMEYVLKLQKISIFALSLDWESLLEEK